MAKKKTRRKVNPMIALVDADRRSMQKTQKLLKSAGFAAKTYAVADEFLKQAKSKQPTVVICECRLAGWTVTDLIETLDDRSIPAEVIVFTKHATVSDTVEFIQGGAFHLLQKDAREQLLIDTVNRALQSVVESVDRVSEYGDTRKKLALLSRRESEIVHLLAYGFHNADVAKRLKIQARTVEAHRASIMRKFETNKFMDVARRYLLLKLASKTGCKSC